MAHDVSQLLGDEGPFAEALQGFARRADQQRLAQAIDQAIASRETLIAEAGTGIGKTFAYLTPVIAGGHRAIVSTGTRNLQDQLFDKDVPTVARVLGREVVAVRLKGRSNYLCHHRLEQAAGEAKLSHAEAGVLHQLRRWSTRSVSGDLAEFAQLTERERLYPRVTSTQDNCLGTDCPAYDRCFVYRARRAAQDAELVVVNHHVLLSDAALRQGGFSELLPDADVVVVDEAHRLPAAARQFFGRSLSYRAVRELLRDLRAEAGEVSGALNLLNPLIDSTAVQLDKLRLTLSGLTRRTEWRRDMDPDLYALDEVLDELQIEADRLADASRGLERGTERLAAMRQFIADLTDGGTTDQLGWVEARGKGFAIHLSPLSVSEPLQEYRAASQAAWVFTSATLSAGDEFAHFAGEVGSADPVTLEMPSPFDFPRQALLYRPPSLPDPREPHRFVAALMEAAYPVLVASGGRAFMLFTSHRNLDLAAQWLAQHGEWPLFVQGTASQHQLLQSFRDSQRGVLLGAQSFWEGVDVAGEALSCVVIDKLPFAPPDDPLNRALSERIRANGGDAFAELHLPQAVLALKQGAGRLIRSDSDRGVLLIGDPRLFTKGYGKHFLRALPPARITDDLAEVEQFLARQAAADPA